MCICFVFNMSNHTQCTLHHLDMSFVMTGPPLSFSHLIYLIYSFFFFFFLQSIEPVGPEPCKIFSQTNNPRCKFESVFVQHISAARQMLHPSLLICKVELLRPVVDDQIVVAGLKKELMLFLFPLSFCITQTATCFWQRLSSKAS